MKVSEIGPHDHGLSGNFVEKIIDGNGRVAHIIVFSRRDARVVEHIMAHHLDDSSGFSIKRVFTGEPNTTEFIFSVNGIDTVPIHVTTSEEI